MKTREELAEEYASRDQRYATNLGFSMCVDAYVEGFATGFARACELLRSEEFRLWFSEPADQKSCADWLERQQKTPDETFTEEKKK